MKMVLLDSHFWLIICPINRKIFKKAMWVVMFSKHFTTTILKTWPFLSKLEILMLYTMKAISKSGKR